jgi:hypothetical protein
MMMAISTKRKLISPKRFNPSENDQPTHRDVIQPSGGRIALGGTSKNTMNDNLEERRPHKVKAQRTVFTFALLSAAGWHALKDGQERLEGSFFEWMTAGVFAAFSLEAYLNHLGPKRSKCWSGLERLSVGTKLELILEDLDHRPDFSSRPFQTMKDLLRFRNQVAHGKSERGLEDHYTEAFAGRETALSRAMVGAQCTQGAAQRFMEDVTAVITQLQTFAGLDTRFLFSPEEGSSIRSAIDQIADQRLTAKKKPPRE